MSHASSCKMIFDQRLFFVAKRYCNLKKHAHNLLVKTATITWIIARWTNNEH